MFFQLLTTKDTTVFTLITWKLRLEEIQTQQQPAHKGQQHPSQEIFLALSVKDFFFFYSSSLSVHCVSVFHLPTYNIIPGGEDHIKGVTIAGQDRVAQTLWVFLGGGLNPDFSIKTCGK